MFLNIHVKFLRSLFILFFLIMQNLLLQGSIVCAQENIVNNLAGVPADFPPQYSIDKKTGQPVGFAIDIMDEVAKKIGLTVQYKVFDTWPEAILALKEKRIHLIPNIGIISERKSDFDFTIPVETFHISLFIRNSTTDIHDVTDLTDRIVAVVKLNKGLFIMKEQEGVKLQIHDSLEQALLSLLSGNADAFVYPEPPVKLILLRSGIEDRIKIVGKPLMEIKRGMAVQKGFITLQEKLNDVIRDFVETPEYQKIYTKWYGEAKPFWNIKKVIIAMGILFALTILCLIVWHYLSIIHLNKSLNESEHKFRTVADFAYDWEFWLKPDCSHIYSSPSCKRITGYDPDDFINNPGLMMEIIHPDDRATFIKHRQIVDQLGKIFPIIFRIITKDGDEHCIEHVCQAVYDTDEQHLGQRGSNRDITEQKKLQEEVLKARKLESIGTLAGGIAHDFNNLLYVVLGNIGLAEDNLQNGNMVTENLKKAEQACIKAKELAARLITFSKGGDPVKKMMAINDFLKDMVISALSGSDITPEISIADAVRQVNIDEDQIKQVVRNIVVNAREAIEDKGQLNVSCENVDIAEKGYLALSQGEYIKISFKDHGFGISKENLDKIFDPYFSTKDMGADKGQGLGLTVSYSIIQKHGGLISVESEPQTGSTFSVYLPAFSVKEPDLQKSEEKPAAQKPVKKPAKGKGKILLMDDEEAIRTLLRMVISRLGYDVETCIEGREALEIYKKAMESKEPFDMVILDLTSKIGMGGQETMRRLLEINPDVKGIIITGYSDDPVVANFSAYGFSGFVIKPATRDELSKVINEVLSKEL